MISFALGRQDWKERSLTGDHPPSESPSVRPPAMGIAVSTTVTDPSLSCADNTRSGSHLTAMDALKPRRPRAFRATIVDVSTRVYRILLVDAHVDSLRCTARLLQSLGYECLMAETGGDALLLGQTHKIDILVTDLFLPDITGTLLVEQFAVQFRVPAVVVSGCSPCELRETPPGVDFLIKPIEAERLHQSIRRVLSRQ